MAFLLSLAKICPPGQQFYRSILIKRLDYENNDKKSGEAHTIFVITHVYTNEKSHFEIKESYIYFPHSATFYKIKFPCRSLRKSIEREEREEVEIPNNNIPKRQKRLENFLRKI